MQIISQQKQIRSALNKSLAPGKRYDLLREKQSLSSFFFDPGDLGVLNAGLKMRSKIGPNTVRIVEDSLEMCF